LYRLINAQFSRMLNDPDGHRLLRFAGQRMRMAEAIVEFRDRVPREVVRLVYKILTFDGEGRLDRRAFDRQNAAIVDIVVGATFRSTSNNAPVVEAANRFVAQGGRWQPSASLAQRIRHAVLGELKCERL
jgi:hypothetical protein